MTIRKQARHCAEALGRVISVKCHKQPPPEVRTAAFPKTEAEWWCWDLSLWPFPSRSLPCAPPGGRQPPLHGRAKGSPSEMLARCSPFHHLYLEVLASKG